MLYKSAWAATPLDPKTVRGAGRRWVETACSSPRGLLAFALSATVAIHGASFLPICRAALFAPAAERQRGMDKPRPARSLFATSGCGIVSPWRRRDRPRGCRSARWWAIQPWRGLRRHLRLLVRHGLRPIRVERRRRRRRFPVSLRPGAASPAGAAWSQPRDLTSAATSSSRGIVVTLAIIRRA